jgi:transcription antitermination factor NusG
MNRAADSILAANKDRNITLNAQVLDPFVGNFPEVIISQTAHSEIELPSEVESLKTGKKVIIINGPDANKIGKIESILPKKQKLPSGIETKVAEVSLSNDQLAAIPLTNLEIIK